MLNGVNAQPSAGAIAVGGNAGVRADARTGQYRPSLDAMQPRGQRFNRLMHWTYTLATVFWLALEPKDKSAMKVFVTGGTGLIGRALVKRLLVDGHDITVLTRQSLDSSETVTYVNSFEDLDARQDIVVNLAGAGLADRRWSP